MVLSILESRKERIKNKSDENLILDLQSVNDKNQNVCENTKTHISLKLQYTVFSIQALQLPTTETTQPSLL